MTDWREELIEKVALCMERSQHGFSLFESASNNMRVCARAALAVAEPVIREQCAAEADHRAKTVGNGTDEYSLACRHVASAIREGGKDE